MRPSHLNTFFTSKSSPTGDMSLSPMLCIFQKNIDTRCFFFSHSCWTLFPIPDVLCTLSKLLGTNFKAHAQWWYSSSCHLPLPYFCFSCISAPSQAALDLYLYLNLVFVFVFVFCICIWACVLASSCAASDPTGRNSCLRGNYESS